jgi:RND family efflux transporter MFP subunit
MRTKKIVLVLLGTLALMGGVGYVVLDGTPKVSAAPPTRGPAVKAVYATGNVEPVTWAKITPLVKGRIIDLCICEGKATKRGEVLARLDDREERAALRELQSRERFLGDEVKRYKALIGKNFVSQQNYDRASADHAMALASVAQARKRLENMVLLSPMDGTVLRRDGELGEVAEPGQALFWVGKPKPLWIVAEVDEEDIPFVRLGQRTLIKADAFAGQVLTGTVSQITPKGDPINKTYRVRVTLPDDTPLLIGMTTEINIVVEEKQNALLVPITAIGGGQVWLIKDGRAHPQPVKLGIVGDKMVEIVDGLGESDIVMTEPPAGIKDGRRVRQAQPPKPAG